MSQSKCHENESYRQYIELLRQLHAAMSTNPVDESQADAIRDRMDGPWRGMNSAEIDRVRGLSADLYSLEIKEDRSPDPLTDDGRDLCKEFQQAFDLKQWDQALTALRKAAPFFELSHLSLARGRIWSRLGDPDTAILFYQHAGDLVLKSAADKYKALAGKSSQ